MPVAVIRQFFNRLNHDYMIVHQAKEALFWTTHMALGDDHERFASAEIAYKDFISCPQRLEAVHSALAELATLPDDEEKRALEHGLRGWRALFECNVIGGQAAREAQRRLIEMESALLARRQGYVMVHIDERGEQEEASLGALTTNLANNRDEGARKSSHDARLGLEQWVLSNGFVDIVKQRNRLARARGFDNFFDYTVQKNDRTSTDQLFALLGDFEARTRDIHLRALGDLAARSGPDALRPWNLPFHMGGDVGRRMAPYLPYDKAVERWVKSFRRLGIGFRGAALQLDLFTRKGKFPIGFCHAPVPPFLDEGRRVAAQINFTANGQPDQPGSGNRALATLFHEAGHAAHFANIAQNAPCFSQEFAPMSPALAEAQAKFCESLLAEPDWLKRYARDRAGEAVPDALLHAHVVASQPFAAYGQRTNLCVSYFERALYEMPDEALSPDSVRRLARDIELRILGLPLAPSPLLTIPHLLNHMHSAYYHSYLLANMAASQMRAFFLREHGYLIDNPAVGPSLAEHCWQAGSSISLDDALVRLTGEAFNARYLADACSRSVEEAWAEAQRRIAAGTREGSGDEPADLDARIRLMHGEALIADDSEGDEAMFRRFENWVAEHYPKSPEPA